ncbi:hypothetical protein KIT04_072 [Vibrio phage KIT04]|nr:hypothetical protein KIT04_072 [Vibrio phage KIT04]
MKNVVISESLFKAMIEQLNYWADYCDDSEGYLAAIIEEATEEASKDVLTFTREEMDILERHVDLGSLFRE